MIRRNGGRRGPWAVVCLALAVPAALAVGQGGCINPQIRSQCAEEADHEVKYDVETVGDVTAGFSNAEPIAVGGVGLVVGLDGTGSPPPADNYRAMLEDELLKHNVRDVKELLASKDVSLVLVSGVVPAGARTGDPLDVEVTVPPGSQTTSLHGGYLKDCVLYNYEYEARLNPAIHSGKALRGHALARAEGPLLVGLDDGDEAARERHGRIWGGATCKITRPFYLLLDKKHEYAYVASAVADRINECFRGTYPVSPGNQMAVAETKKLVVLQVPPPYRRNLQRFLRVVRLVPLREKGAKDGKATAGAHPSYRRRLETDLLDPAHTVIAALRLEALGTASVPALKAGLASPHPLVRFCAAEALAYLDSPSGGDVLAQTVEQHPVLRAFSLTALASMDQAVSHVRLRDLLASAQPETRYGAFRALRALDENDPAVQGELLHHSFWLHRVAPESPPLVHLTSSKRAEVVLFGEEPRLLPPFELLAGTSSKFTVTAGDSDQGCVLSRFDVGRSAGGPRRQTRQCSLKLEDILRTLAGLGGTYAEAVEVLRQADACHVVSCPVAVDQLPQAVSVEELARAGATDPELRQLDGGPRDARPDSGDTPTLYQKSDGLRTSAGTEGDGHGGKGVE